MSLPRARMALLAAARLMLVMVLVLLLVWLLLSLSPMDPLQAHLGGNLFGVSAPQKLHLLQQLGLDQSVAARLQAWGAQLLAGDLGFSNLYHQAVTEVISERLPLSLLLLGVSWLVSLVLGYGLGLVCGLYEGSRLDTWLVRIAWVMSAIPSFWLGMLMISLLAVSLQWLPVCCAAPIGLSFSEQSAGQMLQHLLLPILTISLVHMAPIILHTRAKVIDVMASEYVGYSALHQDSRSSIVSFHVIKNSLVPALILQCASIAELFGGSMLAETLFSYPGLGQALVKAALAQDTALFMAATVISALLVFGGNALANLLAIGLTAGDESL